MKQNENEFKILVSSNSPVFDISAIVEQNKEVAYFYLTNSKSLNLKMKSCWIKNFNY